MKPLPDDSLDRLLDRWSTTPPPSPGLATDVWQRIATRRTIRPIEKGIWKTFEDWLRRPAFAAGFVAACALLGIVLAELRLGHLQRERNAQLARSYLELIDPLSGNIEPPRRS